MTASGYVGELIIPLPNGGTLRCGKGTDYLYGNYLRVCNAAGDEVVYWDKQEWADEPEQVIGAVFVAATTDGATLAEIMNPKE